MFYKKILTDMNQASERAKIVIADEASSPTRLIKALSIYLVKINLFALMVVGLIIIPARASILLPVLMLAKPGLVEHFQNECLKITANDNLELRSKMARPCQVIANPIAECLLVEADKSGKSFQLISETLSGKLGAAGEIVVKNCIAKMIGVPRDTFDNVPLMLIVENNASKSKKTEMPTKQCSESDKRQNLSL